MVQKKYMILFFLTMAVIIFTTTGQILWKLGVVGKIKNFESLIKIFASPLVLAGIFFYLVAVLIWTFLLSRYQFYLIYSLLSLSFIFLLLASRFILHEEISWLSWIGGGIIFLGIIIVGLGLK